MKKLSISLLLFIASLLGLAHAQDKPDTPVALTGGKVIAVDEAKKLLDEGKAQFFDTRSALNYGKGHIQGAKLLAYKEKSEFTANFDATQDKFELDKLPADKSIPIVIYSDSAKGWKSYKGAVLAIKAGHKNVMWLREGTTGWGAKGLALQ